jgi:uncharacterized membrane protein
MITVAFYTRNGCHLCEQAQADLEALRVDYPFELRVVDIDQAGDLSGTYALEIPVVEVGPYRLKAPFTRQELQMTLMAASDRQDHIERIESSPGISDTRGWTRADAFSYWFSRHYMAFLNLWVVFYLGLPIMAPVLMKTGFPGPADLIYRAYSFVCHQLAFRTFFLFGEQAVYPRTAAGVSGLQTLSQATGLGEGNTNDELYAARNFVGNDVVGYKIALCERDVAIYGGILIFGLLFSLFGRKWPALPWYLWIFLALGPIGLDGFSQLVSQPPFNLIPFRESTPFLRVLTGGLFGTMTAWFGYPIVEETMGETRRLMGERWRRLQRLMPLSKA